MFAPSVEKLLGPPGYACPIYSRTGKVTEGGEATARHMFCKIDVAKREKFATVTQWRVFSPIWRSIALVWSCLSYLPAWHQQLLMQAGGK